MIFAISDLPPAPAPVPIIIVERGDGKCPDANDASDPDCAAERYAGKRDEFPERRCGSGGVGGDCTFAVSILTPALNDRGSGR
jgi:hypothetical protein